MVLTTLVFLLTSLSAPTVIYGKNGPTIKLVAVLKCEHPTNKWIAQSPMISESSIKKWSRNVVKLNITYNVTRSFGPVELHGRSHQVRANAVRDLMVKVEHASCNSGLAMKLMKYCDLKFDKHCNLKADHTNHMSKVVCSHHQPINVPTAGAQAFPMDGIGRFGHDPPRGLNAYLRVLTTADAAGTNGLTSLLKHGGTRDRRFLAIHPMTDHCESCLTSTIAAERANHPRHRAPLVRNISSKLGNKLQCEKDNNNTQLANLHTSLAIAKPIGRHRTRRIRVRRPGIGRYLDPTETRAEVLVSEMPSS
ncbi:hypothetical protein evm_013179 [Chilo suppressalis]|nr:hypothetical protein evm_013179 [Chilo suppressalis]